MGGKLLSHYGLEPCRLARREYFKIVSLVEHALAKNGIIGADIPTFRKKESFGDLDFLCLNTKNDQLKDIVTKEFNPRFYHSNGNSNGNIFSFEVDGFQVDLITVSPNVYPFARTYFSYSDVVGNLFGRIAHKMGLKLGWQGLHYIIREEQFEGTNNSHVIDEVLITTNPREAWEFLGANFYSIQQGFDSVEHSFIFVANSPYFNPEIFSYENLNHINRTRNRKRENYQKFLEFVSTLHPQTPRYEFLPKSHYFSKIMEKWPQFKDDFDKSKERYFSHKAFKAKYNGAIISEWTGFKGEILGQFMKRLKLAGVEQEVQVLSPDVLKNTVLMYAEFFKEWTLDKPVNKNISSIV